jgi:large subunit ribosomal protein L25
MRKQSTLKAEMRGEQGKEAAKRLRDSGRVPAVLYGRGFDAVSISVPAHDAELLFRSISVENTLVQLEIDGEKGPVQSLIREIQVHPYKPQLLHVDFYRIREGETVEVEIPVHLKGVPAGVRDGGVLQHTVHDLRVRCLPTAIPESIDLDVSGLKLGDSIHVADVPVSEGVQILAEPDRTICSVNLPRAEETKPAAAVEGAEGEAVPGAAEKKEEEK